MACGGFEFSETFFSLVHMSFVGFNKNNELVLGLEYVLYFSMFISMGMILPSDYFFRGLETTNEQVSVLCNTHTEKRVVQRSGSQQEWDDVLNCCQDQPACLDGTDDVRKSIGRNYLTSYS